jgi:tetratricopeptide (TPR) repeat protein
MRIADWIAIAKKEAKSYRQLVCEFCGAETLTGSASTFCSNCESIIGSHSKTVERSNPNLFASLNAIRNAVTNNDFDGASAIYDQMITDRPIPQLFYAKGLLKIEHSNYSVSQISYDKEGFMEHNAELREQGAHLISEAKKLIAKSRGMSEKELAEKENASVLYRIFLCDLKMNDLRSASENLKKMDKLNKDGALSSYAKVVLNTQAGLYKEAAGELDKLVKDKAPPSNAFYYAAFVAFKTGDHKGALKLINVSGGLVENQKRSYIMEAIAKSRE